MLASTLQQAELLSTDIQTLMNRLFWEETIRVFDPQHPQFHCSCTREKVGINCDFCGKHYQFDTVDCAQLFASDTPVEVLLPASDVKH